MFDFEAYYKLPNARCEGKYQELKHFLDGFVKDSAARSGREKSFRDRMLAYSRKQAVYLHYLTELEEKYTDEFVRYSSYSTLSEVQKTLFGDFTPEGYVSSTCNPSYTVSVAGKEIGPALAQFASIFREGAMDAISHRRYRLLSKMELYFELHKQLLHGQVRADHLQSLYESFRLNQVNEEMDLRFHKNFDPNASFLTDAVMNADFSDEAYLFEMGQPVTEAALHLNKALVALDQAQLMEAAEKISLRMLCNQPSKRNQQGIKRNLVSLSLPLGAERFAKMLILSLEKNGAEGFISELVPYGLHPKFLKDHRYDIVRGQTDETFQDVKEYVEHITRDNSHLLSGVLGQIQVI
ncbi:MAG: hypothetical protein J6P72_07730, partial [Firmicutes bacterium]|nr:hypothetical protein [Bacillota bacterium]